LNKEKQASGRTTKTHTKFAAQQQGQLKTRDIDLLLDKGKKCLKPTLKFTKHCKASILCRFLTSQATL
jgi:hypothetical protein